MIVLRRGLRALRAIRRRLTNVTGSTRTTIGTNIDGQGSLLRIRLHHGRAGDNHVGLRGDLTLTQGLLTRCVNRPTSDVHLSIDLSNSIPRGPRTLQASRRTSLPLAPRCNLLRRRMGSNHLRCGVTINGGLPAVTVKNNCFCRGLVSESRSF